MGTLANRNSVVNEVTNAESPGGTVDIDVRNQGAVKIIKLRGRLALGESVDRLRATVEDLLQAGDNRLVLDAEELATMDSSGIGLLSRFLTLTKQSGGSLKLVNPSKFVVQTLKLVGLLNLFEVFTDSQAAAGSFN
ncbi:MAG TPA: STAS domain-containing protein [Terriglobales bacterium]|nr:STAS domain-containing protein [Terriglobales bacterium]